MPRMAYPVFQKLLNVGYESVIFNCCAVFGGGVVFVEECYIFYKGTTKLVTRSLRRKPQTAAP